MQLQLPEPSADALAASHALRAHVANEICQQGGWISFARYMELVLYAPALGYYSGGATKLGRDGDFTTAPEMTPLFGAALAQAVAGLLGQTGPRIMEFGAGSGKLARDVLSELALLGVAVDSYAIVELSGELRERQQAMLSDFPQVRWLDELPTAFSGVVLGNEVLDAMPVHVVMKTAEGWMERGVTWEEERFAWKLAPCSDELVQQIPSANELPEGYVTEVHPISLGFMDSLARLLCKGAQEEQRGSAAILIDYGFPAREYYLDQRVSGTLMCHYRHHAHDDPFYYPGLQDITAHVDFTATALAAVAGGMEVLTYTSQGAFLLQAGAGDLLLRTSPEEVRRYLPQANALQKLTSPAEMGELFKVLVLGRAVELPEHYLQYDRTHRL